MINIGLKVKIITAVLSVTMLVNLFVTYYLIENEKVDAQVINIAGKQRMLTQKAVGEFHRLTMNKKDAKTEINDVDKIFRENLKRLLSGNLSHGKNLSIHNELVIIEKRWSSFKELMLLASKKSLDIKRDLVYEEGNKLLNIIDKTVQAYEIQAKNKKDFIKSMQFVLGFIALMIIVYMAKIALGINAQLNAFLKRSTKISGHQEKEKGNELEVACLHIQYFLNDVEHAIDSATKAVEKSEQAALELANEKNNPQALQQLDNSEDIVIETNEELYKTANVLKKLKQKLQENSDISF